MKSGDVGELEEGGTRSINVGGWEKSSRAKESTIWDRREKKKGDTKGRICEKTAALEGEVKSGEKKREGGTSRPLKEKKGRNTEGEKGKNREVKTMGGGLVGLVSAKNGATWQKNGEGKLCEKSGCFGACASGKKKNPFHKRSKDGHFKVKIVGGGNLRMRQWFGRWAEKKKTPGTFQERG